MAELLTIEEFLAFTDTRPDEERWELIEGVPVLNASPTDYHQIVVLNIASHLLDEKKRLGAAWFPLPGIGTRVPASTHSLPQPDVMVKERAATGSAISDDALVIFEVLSKSNTKDDQSWRRKVYASVPNCRHYVTISLKAVEVVVHDRDNAWKGRRLNDLAESVELSALGIALPLSTIYRSSPFGAAS